MTLKSLLKPRFAGPMAAGFERLFYLRLGRDCLETGRKKRVLPDGPAELQRSRSLKRRPSRSGPEECGLWTVRSGLRRDRPFGLVRKDGASVDVSFEARVRRLSFNGP
jgi:hypothetical protein